MKYPSHYASPIRGLSGFKVPDSWIILPKFYELYRNGGLSRAELEKRKLKKFRKLVAYANRKSPYYKDIIRKHNIDINTCVPTDFPIINKSILMDNFDQVVTDPRITKNGIIDFLACSSNPHDLFLNEYRVVHSSGTSGQLGYFIYSSADWLKGLTQGLRLKPLHRLFDPRHFALICAVGGHFGGEATVATGIYNATKKRHQIHVYEINDPLSDNVAKLNTFQPKILGGYTTSLRILAEKQRDGELSISPIYIEAMGETLAPSDKAFLQSIFKCEIFNLYGSSENLLMGIAKPGEPGVTLYDDDLIYELRDDSTIITNLFNFTLPLIRYRSSDILTPQSQKLRNTPYIEIENLIGRTETRAAFINQNGVRDFVTSYMLEEDIKGVRRFQLIPVDELNFDFHICFETDISDSQKPEIIAAVHKWLVAILHPKLMDNVKYRIIVLEDILPDLQTRKFQLILNKQ